MYLMRIKPRLLFGKDALLLILASLTLVACEYDPHTNLYTTTEEPALRAWPSSKCSKQSSTQELLLVRLLLICSPFVEKT
jgi:hypothetical protein